mmetsp:Transcript_82750/g.210536  ORF Transcript_82750/g.210536 Transcript_82750/m.210536 type:complete len:539 (+) Transcript_82750:156-1772(+)
MERLLAAPWKRESGSCTSLLNAVRTCSSASGLGLEVYPAGLRGGDDHALADGRCGHTVEGLHVVSAEHVGEAADDLQESELLTLAQTAAATEGDVRELARDAVDEPEGLELRRIREALLEHPCDIGRDADNAILGEVELLEFDVRLHSTHEQHQRRVQTEVLHDSAPELLHLLIAHPGEGLVGTAQDRMLLLNELLHERGPGEDLQGRPGGRDGAVVHASKESGHHEANNLLVGNGAAIRVRGSQHLPQEVVLLHGARGQALPAVRDDRCQELAHLPARRITGPVALDGQAGHEHRERQHALLQRVQQLADGVAPLVSVHLLPELLAHKTPDGGPRQALDHRLADADDALVAGPLLLEVLLHLSVQSVNVGAEAVLRQPLANEPQLAHARGVVRVVQHLLAKDRDREGIHLGLIEVLVHSEEELMCVATDHEDHILGQKVDVEALALLLVASLHQIQGTLEELVDGSENWQAEHVEGWRHLASPEPSADEQPSNNEYGCTGRDQRGERLLLFGHEFAQHGSRVMVRRVRGRRCGGRCQ